MDERRLQLLARLLALGERHDRREANRLRRYRNITHDTGEFLSLLVQALPARRVLEVGTSNGYSALWLADALEQTGGGLVTVESDPGRAAEAEAHWQEAAVASQIELLRGSAQEILPTLVAGPPYDLIFLDAERTEYMALWPQIEPLIRRERGLLVVDNAVSHAQELSEFTAMLAAHPRFVTSLVPVGKGEYLALSTG
jgi:predicted O-methyltransferase YrrM